MTPDRLPTPIQLEGRPDIMTEHSLWRLSRALHRAINERQLEEFEALIDEEVDWAIHGPIEMFPFLGARRGKAAVLEVCRQISENVRVHRFDRPRIRFSLRAIAQVRGPGRRAAADRCPQP